MKRIYIFAASALLFAACSSDDLSISEKNSPVAVNESSVSFDAYLQRGVTRAGATRDLDLAKLKDAEVGFGVFGYYTDNKDYDQLAQPNFFYNQQVTFDGTSKWTYAPIKYWPNEYGNNATSDDNDRVTYFAYAPYVNVDPKTGKYVPDAVAISTAESALTTAQTNLEASTWTTSTEKGYYDDWVEGGKPSTDPGEGNKGHNYFNNKTAVDAALNAYLDLEAAVSAAQAKLESLNGTTGITGMTHNIASGDPVVKYVGSFKQSEAVDLCWGVCPQTEWPLVNTGVGQTMTVGKPWINVERPSQTTQPVKFQFKHALAKMQVNIDAYVDGTDNTNIVDSKTRVWVRQVKFNGFTMKGALNLNNETANQPYWMNYNGVGDLESDGEIIIYDGRKDGKEAVQGATATNEKSLGLNTEFVETEAAFSSLNTWGTIPGVTKTTKTLFDGGGIFYVIPTGDEMEVEIIYDVETISENLGFTLADNRSQGTAIQNRISKKISFGGTYNKLESGKAYQINLHLGLNSVEFDADVVGWEDMTPADVDLPANVPFYPAETTGTGKATIPYDVTKFQFGINGLNGGEAVKATAKSFTWNSASGVATTSNDLYLPSWTTTENTNANGSGYEVITLATTANTTTSNRIQVVEWAGQSSGKKVTMTFTQLAAPLALKAPSTTSPASATGSGANAIYKYQLNRTGADYGFFCTGYNSTAANCYKNMDAQTSGNEGPSPKIQVWRNGTPLTWAKSNTEAASLTATEFTFTDTGMLTVKENFVAGDVIKVTLKTGDAPEETISWTVTAATPTP